MRDHLAPGCFAVDTASLGGGGAPAPAPVTKGVGDRIFSGTFLGGWAGGMFPNWWSQSIRQEQVLHWKFWVQVAITRKMQEAAAHFPNFAVVTHGDEAAKPRSPIHRRVREARYKKSLHQIRPHEEVDHLEEGHPLVQLFRHPNKWDTAGRIWSRLMMYLDLTGNAYLWVIPDRAGRPLEIWVLPSQWVLGPRLTKAGIWYYQVMPIANFGQGVMLPPEEVIHFQHDNPHTPIDGWAPTQGGAEWIDVQESINRRRFWMMKNIHGFAGAIELDPQFQDIDQQDGERLAAKLAARYQGEHREGLPLILPPGAKFQPLRIVPAEMDFVQSHEQMRDSTLALFGVPKEIATIQDAGSEIAIYGPMQLFCRFTMGSWFRNVGEVLTKELAKRYDDRIRIWWDDITPENMSETRQNVQVAASNGAITVNEIRSTLLQLDPLDIPEADKPLVNPQLVPLGEGGDLFGGVGGEGGGGMPGAPGPEQEGEGGGGEEDGGGDDAPDMPQDDEDLSSLGKGFVDDLLSGWDADTADIQKWHGGEAKGFGDCPRDAHGRCKPKGEGDEAGKDKPQGAAHPGSPELHAEATSAARKLVGLVRKLPEKVWSAAKNHVASKYNALASRYGKPTALAIMGAGVAGAVALAPIPGGGLLAAAPVLGAAELYLRLRGGNTKHVRPSRKEFDPSEPRDEGGRWTEGAGSGKKPEGEGGGPSFPAPRTGHAALPGRGPAAGALRRLLLGDEASPFLDAEGDFQAPEDVGAGREQLARERRLFEASVAEARGDLGQVLADYAPVLPGGLRGKLAQAAARADASLARHLARASRLHAALSSAYDASAESPADETWARAEPRLVAYWEALVALGTAAAAVPDELHDLALRLEERAGREARRARRQGKALPRRAAAGARRMAAFGPRRKARRKAKGVDAAGPRLDVPLVYQDDDYDCGASSLRMAAEFFRVLPPPPDTEEAFVRLLGTTPADGTPPGHIIAAARRMGLAVEARDGMTVADLAAAASSGRPVLCCVQYEGAGWDEGHWLVVTGADGSRVYVNDPSRGEISFDVPTWDSRWHDESADGTRYVRYGVAVGPAAPPVSKEFNPSEPRDESGQWTSGGKKPGGRPADSANKPAPKPNNTGGVAATPEEHKAAQKLARSKVKNAPVPPPEKVAKMREALRLAREGKGRPGGDARGSSADRKARARNLFKEFGGLERGYVVCHGTGIKMHWTDDPELNPHGYPKFEQGKIFTACQGGGYYLANLLPESFAYNRSRNDKRLRKENADGC